MSPDPFAELRDDLVAAAHRRQIEGRSVSTTRVRRSRPLLIALAALIVAAPATAAITGVQPFGSGSTPDGSTYTTQDVTVPASSTTQQQGNAGPEPGSQCRRVDFHDASGNLTTRTMACRRAGSTGAANGRVLNVGFVVAPGHSLLIQGDVAADVARVTVSGVDGEITLADDDDGRHKFSATTTQDKPTVVAYDSAGHELGRFDVPL